MNMVQSHYKWVLSFVVIIVYLNSFFGEFQFDDYNVIVENPLVHTWNAWAWDVSTGIRPLLKFTYMLNWISGLDLLGFHVVNITIHTINTLLFYFLSLKFMERHPDVALNKYKYKIAFITALLFGIHPVQAEAVTYISGRSTSLMAMFYLGCLLTYIHGAGLNKRFYLYVMSPVLFIMSVAVKEIAVTIPAAMLLWEVCCSNRLKWRDIARYQVIHWMILVVAGIALAIHPVYSDLLMYGFDKRSLSVNLLTQINGVTYLLSRLIFINRLSIDPDLPVIYEWNVLVIIELLLLVSLLVIGVLGIMRMRCFYSRPWIGFGILWFFLHLIPTNSIVPRLDVANERQLYMAVWGLFFATVIELSLIKLLWQRYFNIGIGLVMVVVLLLAYSTISRNHTYRSEVALWKDTVSKSPANARAYNNLGFAYYLEGRHREARNAYNKSLKLRPDYGLAKNNLRVLAD